MDREKIARELLGVAKLLMSRDTPNPLDGMSKQKAIRVVNKLLSKHTKGLFRDEYWAPISKIWKELNDNDIPHQLESAKYYKDDYGRPQRKVWRFTTEFLNNRGRPTMLYGSITASGAGSVEDPLDRYDLTAYMS